VSNVEDAVGTLTAPIFATETACAMVTGDESLIGSVDTPADRDVAIVLMTGETPAAARRQADHRHAVVSSASAAERSRAAT
jgi:hypothetical protein